MISVNKMAPTKKDAPAKKDDAPAKKEDAPAKKEDAPAKKEDGTKNKDHLKVPKNTYVPTGKPRGRAPGQKNKKKAWADKMMALRGVTRKERK